MKGLSRVALGGSIGTVVFAFVLWIYLDLPISQVAANALVPLGMFLSAGAYGVLGKYTSIPRALIVVVPFFLMIAVLKQILCPLPDGFSWSYALLFGGTVGAIWGCALPLLARYRREKSGVV